VWSAALKQFPADAGLKNRLEKQGEELADIGNLLGQLTASVHDSGPAVSTPQLQDGGSLASLSSFQFAYREQIRANYSQSQLAPPATADSQDPIQQPTSGA